VIEPVSPSLLFSFLFPPTLTTNGIVALVYVETQKVFSLVVQGVVAEGFELGVEHLISIDVKMF
jgi:hypothetical protein